ncbi:hypothetical protein R1flu_027704 [Riccia fluitans]|uniref:Uncharacterized protein n=1 Tax=Riccia fluitans TaxID=41844 RepID=A0ABD1XMI3_9MARC
MWNCLPLRNDTEDKDDSEGKKALVKEQQPPQLLQSKMSSANNFSDQGEFCVTENDDKTAVLAKMVRWQWHQGATLCFRYMMEYLGQIIVTYIHGVEEKLDKLESHYH